MIALVPRLSDAVDVTKMSTMYVRSTNKLAAFMGATFTRISGKQLYWRRSALLAAAAGGFLTLVVCFCCACVTRAVPLLSIVLHRLTFFCSEEVS